MIARKIAAMTDAAFLSRRNLLQAGAAGAAALMLTGCQQAGRAVTSAVASVAEPFTGDIFDAEAHYAARRDGGFDVPAIPINQISAAYLRQRVGYQGTEVAGTIVVDPYDRFLYFVEPAGTAVRYGVGVGRDGFNWSGFARVGRKAAWPRWNPPKEMQARDPRAAEWANGMPGGLENPLGARALYLFEDGRDTLYRLHGTNEPLSIGQAVSSGCVRMFNQDAIDLYNRSSVGSDVVVLGTA
jgi:lipoprotein-anchoring transpeptidase ErfK/SrfK